LINIDNYFIREDMFLKKYLFVLAVIPISFLSFSQTEGLKLIDKADLKRHLEYIASDSLQGRGFGTHPDGLKATAEYIRNRVVMLGLEPGGADFFQPLELISVKPDKENTFFEVKGKEGKPAFKTHSIVKIKGGIENIGFQNNEVVFADFGWKDDTGYDNLKGLDLKGKVVIVTDGTPKKFLTKDALKRNNRQEQSKLDSIVAKQPAAVIVVTHPKDNRELTFKRLEYWKSRPSFDLKTNIPLKNTPPVLMTVPGFADALFGGKGKYTKYLTCISKHNKPNPVFLKRVEWQGKFVEEVTEFCGRNVVAFVEGSDTELKTECVVFMAHYDHLGVDKDNKVYNGADDNGSGTVVLLELAEAFSVLEIKPKRSIVFLWVTAEETGMFGSRFYTENPAFPLDKTVACINLDMVGRVFEPRDSVWKKSPKRVKDFDGLFTLTNNKWPGLSEISDSVSASLGLVPDKSLPESFLHTSDHYHFHKNNIPVLNISTGYHADYHKVTDEVSKIDFDKMKRVADYCFWMGYKVGNLATTNGN
jgi:hypothetical protein